MAIFLALICVLGLVNAKPAGPSSYSTEHTLLKATSSPDCDPFRHNITANNNGQDFLPQEKYEFQTNDQQDETDHFDSSTDDTVVIDAASESSDAEPFESEEHNIGIAVAVADENESEVPDSTVLEHETFKPEVETNIKASTTDVKSSTNNREYDINVLKVDAPKNKHHKVTAIIGEGTELSITESSLTKIATTESVNDSNKKTELDSKLETLNQNKTVKMQDNKDAKYAHQSSNFFPIYFGSFPNAKSSSEPSGVISIANSFSTGQGGVASSHATAYESRQSSESTR